MRLHSIELRDVRRFERFDLSLEPGLGVLSGPNGAGKTTILDAIGFALFATPLRDGVRDGATGCSVQIAFAQAGEEWVVVRSQAASGTRAELRKAGAKKPVATGSEAVEEHLAGLLRVADRALLPVLFQRLIGTAQGDLERPFLLPTEERRAWFQPLFNLDRYELAARRVAFAIAPFQTEIQVVERELATARGELKGFDSVAERMSECDREATSAASRATELEALIAGLNRETLGFEQMRAELERTTMELAVLEESLRRRQADTEHARQRLDQAHNANQIVAQTRGGHERFQTLAREIDSNQVRRREYDAITAELAELERKLDDGRKALDTERTRLEQALDDAQRGSEETLALRESLRTRIDETRTRARRAEGAGNALRMASARAAELRRCFGDLSQDRDAAATAGPQVYEARAAEAAAQAAATRAATHELEALRQRAAGAAEAAQRLLETRDSAARLQGHRREIEHSLVLVRPSHGACPLLREPCKNLGGMSLVDHYAAELRRLDDAIDTADDAVRIAESRRADAETAAQELARGERESAPRRPPSRATTPAVETTTSPLQHLAFDQIGHHLSALAGVVGAIDPIARRSERPPVALIGAIAGVGDTTPLAPAEINVELPSLTLIERGQELAAAGVAAQESGTAGRALALGAELGHLVRRVCATIVNADAQIREVLTRCRTESSEAEERLLASAKHMEELADERARLRAASKNMSARDLGLLDTEIAVTDRRVKLGALGRSETDHDRMREELETLRGSHEQHESNAHLAYQVEHAQEDWKRLDHERNELVSRTKAMNETVATLAARYNPRAAEQLAREREAAHTDLGQAREAARSLQRERELLRERLGELEHVRLRLEALDHRRAEAEEAVRTVGDLEVLYRRMARPVADRVQRHIATEAAALYREIAGRPGCLRWHDDFALSLEESGGPRAFASLAHGERVTAALAVLLALLRQFPRVGLLCLDEPTAHLDLERRRAFAEALARYRASSRDHVEQILVVSHDRAFDHVAEFQATLPAVD